MIRHLPAAIVLAISLTACSDTPSESKLEQLLQQQFDSQYDALINIEHLKKINGWQESEYQYVAEVSYTIKFQTSFKAYMDEQTAKPGNPLEKMAKGISAGMLKLQYGDFKAGDEYQVKQQTLSLRNAENGWLLQQ
ncbi:hypothetical protein ORJ00_09580 [Rheinheimera baltica]|uniref:hypothetical protein n=1 Tax=Rheinheimera baltica TaxID=67576 RepID=UPI00273E3C23|nr:hypothetical protein [Rheinheimera baltica]MDP5142993.1 hypothetical protein [Rheinheimera baltica]